MIPIENRVVHRQVLEEIMGANLRDEAQSWTSDADGIYKRIRSTGFSCHSYFMTNPSLSGQDRTPKSVEP